MKVTFTAGKYVNKKINDANDITQGYDDLLYCT